ncbi:5-hydroxytryptamine receptor 1D isoform X2 [Glossina fuscipes]|nr:5-hydroxytryptamine receptor 1D isoform X2 [Glossina fuscipes]XP_037883366.1 5-hydroxytryptamine receptor 1D isoform X2 [Glossina fuscipes]XP_037883367.1 5-hydroxytryptamine receptor 1D isoform X2 [Glossina fuscipes]
MDLKSGTLLMPPTVTNSSCSHPRYATHNFIQQVGIVETIEAALILSLTLGVIGANSLVICVINNTRYSVYIHQQPRYLLTSLALNDLAIGLLITPFSLLPALLHCWPYGEIFCQIQALLRGALSQQSAVILVCMAVDRYMCALHPRRYYQHSSKKGCVAVLSLTWIISLTIFGFLVLPKGYYFNNTGLMACEPFFSKPSYRILATCAFYFPTTMVLMYCYGSSFHMSRFRLNDPTMPLTAATQHSAQKHQYPIMNLNVTMGLGMGLGGPTNAITKKIVPIHVKNSSGSTSRSMAAISLGFIVMVTPWTIQEIVTACTGSKLPPFLDFLVTWTALSNSFWNPFMYWLLNSDFRHLSKQMLPSKCKSQEDKIDHKSPCCHINSDFEITTLPMPPEPPTSRLPQRNGNSIRTDAGNQTGEGGSSSVFGICTRSRANSLSHSASFHVRGSGIDHQHSHGLGVATRPDIERLSEKYWGEILERTVSSNSLHGFMQKSYAAPSYHQEAYTHPFGMTSFSEYGKLNLRAPEHGNSSVVNTTNMSDSDLHKFSTSEPNLSDCDVHDAYCAKSKTISEAAAVMAKNLDSGLPGQHNIPDI